MISYSSNINLNAANIIFDKYVSYLLQELSLNNNALQNEIVKISLLKIPQADRDYITNCLSQMETANNAYMALLLSFQEQYVNFKCENLPPVSYHAQQHLEETLKKHLNTITTTSC